ncbi:MAG: hypothetical protein KGM96_12685 [Acidobacteriota bacterium]|nr:hypothetical protein [Acidobacteriota bacterium]
MTLVLPRSGSRGRRKKKYERSEPVRPCGAEAHPFLESVIILILPAEHQEHIKMRQKQRKKWAKLPVSPAGTVSSAKAAHPRRRAPSRLQGGGR